MRTPGEYLFDLAWGSHKQLQGRRGQRRLALPSIGPGRTCEGSCSGFGHAHNVGIRNLHAHCSLALPTREPLVHNNHLIVIRRQRPDARQMKIAGAVVRFHALAHKMAVKLRGNQFEASTTRAAVSTGANSTRCRNGSIRSARTRMRSPSRKVNWRLPPREPRYGSVTME